MKPKNDESLFFHKKYGFEQVGTQKTNGGKKEVSLMVDGWKDKGFTDKQISLSVFKKKDKNDKPIVEIVNFIIKKYAHVIKTFYFMDETGMMEEKKEEFLGSQYVNENDRQIRDRLIVEEGMKLNRLVIEDWSSKELHDETIHKLIAQKKKGKLKCFIILPM